MIRPRPCPALFLSLTVLLLPALAFSQEPKSLPAPTVASTEPPAELRVPDRQAIRGAMTSFAKAFQARDAKALASHWTTEGEHTTVRGVTIHGRPALEAGFTEFFAVTPEITAEVQPESLRFLSSGSAIEQGTVTIRQGAAAAPTRARYEALLVQEENQWRLASLSESAEQGVSVADLDWLIGEWKSTVGGGAEIHTRYAWDANKKFIEVTFSLKEGERTLTGRQVIGVDPATGSLHSWTFEANGGVGEADWSRDGHDWVLTATGSLPNGATLAETNILRRVNADTLTWQSTNRVLSGQEIADLAPVKVTRVTAVK